MTNLYFGTVACSSCKASFTIVASSQSDCFDIFVKEAEPAYRDLPWLRENCVINLTIPLAAAEEVKSSRFDTYDIVIGSCQLISGKTLHYTVLTKSEPSIRMQLQAVFGNALVSLNKEHTLRCKNWTVTEVDGKRTRRYKLIKPRVIEWLENRVNCLAIWSEWNGQALDAQHKLYVLE
jgi:hypothetical protein